MSNQKLINAKRVKNDEFYTRYEDIENEVKHYTDHLKGQWIYCQCDDYERSNFVRYFKDNFNRFQLKRLTATHIHFDGTPSERYDYDGVNETITMLTCDGDFRSEECTRIKDHCDIVITNPPFSLFGQFINWLSDDQGVKKFLVLGSNIAPNIKDVFELMMKNRISIGYVYDKSLTFECQYGTKKVPIGWYSSLPVQCRGMIELTKIYNPEEYPKYDDYDAIEVSKTKNIPMDYTVRIGVPLHFLDKYNPEQFQIIGSITPLLNGKMKFKRIIIRNKHPVVSD